MGNTLPYSAWTKYDLERELTQLTLVITTEKAIMMQIIEQIKKDATKEKISLFNETLKNIQIHYEQTEEITKALNKYD